MRGKRQKKNITLISVTHYKYQSQILTVSTENVPVHHWGSPQLCGAINYNTLEQVEDKYKLKCCYLNLNRFKNTAGELTASWNNINFVMMHSKTHLINKYSDSKQEINLRTCFIVTC